MSDEARVLKQMREAKDLSMRAAGKILGWSDSYISHIENGRVDVPTGPSLDKMLLAYGGITRKSFFERVRRYKVQKGPHDELLELLARLSTPQKQALTILAKQLLATSGNPDTNFMESD